MNSQAIATSVVERLSPDNSRVVSQTLSRVEEAVQAICDPSTVISFRFNGRLHIDIDARTVEELTRIEVLLPGLCGGIFSNLQRGLVDDHPFFHRLRALVDL